MIDSKTTLILKQIVNKYLPSDLYEVFIFGSRATDKNRRFSDIDLGIKGPKSLTPKEYILIKGELDDSDIPYRIDLVDFTKVSDNFKQATKNNIIKI